MKTFLTSIAALAISCAGSLLHSQTLDWGSEVFSDLVNSEGQVLDNTFIFEIGAFTDGFTPDENNVQDWVTNWRAFDRAAYDSFFGYFTSTVQMLDDGTSASPHASSGAPSFEGLNGYLWVRNSDSPEEGTEWFLARADSWVFPNAIPGCCDNEIPFQWSVSDLELTNVPVWGSQGGTSGAGEYTTTGPHSLQTFTFVPEPSSLAMAGMAACLLLRRRREHRAES